MHEAASRALVANEIKVIGRLAATRKWELYSTEFPVIDIGFRNDGRSELRVRILAANWNDDPPSVVLLTADGRPLAGSNVPKHPTGVFNASPHPRTGAPFVCMAGTSEYHTHPSHLNDLWQNYKIRDSHCLAGIATQVWSAWLKSAA